MYFDSLQAALAMDGHGAYVWSAYGITVVVLAIIFLRPLLARRRLLRELRLEQRRVAGGPSSPASLEVS
jgi:heme exporter protein D